MSDHDSGWFGLNGNTRRVAIGGVVTILASGIVGLGRWMYASQDMIARTAEWRTAIEARVVGLENGERTPMARETRVEFSRAQSERIAMEREIEDLRHRIERLEAHP